MKVNILIFKIKNEQPSKFMPKFMPKGCRLHRDYPRTHDLSPAP